MPNLKTAFQLPQSSLQMPKLLLWVLVAHQVLSPSSLPQIHLDISLQCCSHIKETGLWDSQDQGSTQPALRKVLLLWHGTLTSTSLLVN